MKLNDLITLGKMGYTKKDLAELETEDAKGKEQEVDEISALKRQIADITSILQKQATRQPIEEETESKTPDTDEILTQLLRGDTDEQKQ